MAKAHVGLSGYSYKPGRVLDDFIRPPSNRKSFSAITRRVTTQSNWTVSGIACLPKRPSRVDRFDSFSLPLAPKVHRQITHRARLKPDCYEFVHVLLAASGSSRPPNVSVPAFSCRLI